MVHGLKESQSWLAGLQWFFFIFANIVVIPITIGEAFGLEQAEVVPLLRLSFIVTGLACLAQAFLVIVVRFWRVNLDCGGAFT